MAKTFFINFSGSVGEEDTALINRQRLLNITAKKFANIDEIVAWTRNDIINTPFYQENRYILDNPRGAGYWAWKPYIILETLKKAAKNDWVIYCDVGKPFRRGNVEKFGHQDIGNTFYTPVDSIIEYASKHNGFTPGVWIPHYGLAHVWTKRDCFVGMDCDDSTYHNSPHVQAGYSAWSKSQESIAFLEEWLRWCQEPNIITDDKNIFGKPNLEAFRDHRHDQSILSNLVVKHKIALFGPKERSLNGYRNFNLILKHMMLKQSHAQNKQIFSSLFNSKPPHLPIFLKEILELLFLTETCSGTKILLQSDLDALAWQKALPTARFDLFLSESSLGNDNAYDAIFITQASSLTLNKRLFGKLYSSLKPGGLITIGSYLGSKKDAPNANGNFSELMAWLHHHQCLPEGCGDIQDQRPHALTSGSIVNPLISHFNNDSSCFATLIKPKMYLPEHL